MLMTSENASNKEPHRFEPGMVVQRIESYASWAHPASLLPMLVLSTGTFNDFVEWGALSPNNIKRDDKEYIKLLRADGQVVICQSWSFRVLLEPQWTR